MRDWRQSCRSGKRPAMTCIGLLEGNRREKKACDDLYRASGG